MAQVSQTKDKFLFDFLYLDKNRFNSWYSQLAEDGLLLTSVKYSSNCSGSDSDAISAGPKIAMNVTRSVSDTTSEGQERQHSLEWAIPITVLQKLQELSMISKNIECSKVGDILIVTGIAQLLDIKLLQKMLAPSLA